MSTFELSEFGRVPERRNFRTRRNQEMTTQEQQQQQPEREASDEDRELAAANKLRKSAERLVVQDESPLANLRDTAMFEQCYRVARAMASMSILPDHFRYVGKAHERKALPYETVVANCFRVVNQAFRWELDPYAVIDETYPVRGRLGYQGKLVAAIVNTRAGLADRIRYEHKGEGLDRTCTVIGRFKGDDQASTITCRLRDVRTDNQMWTKDPDQKLVYTAVVKWARRHCPEVVLGVSIVEELEADAQAQDNKRIRESDLQIGKQQAEPRTPTRTPPVELPDEQPADVPAELPQVVHMKSLADRVAECKTMTSVNDLRREALKSGADEQEIRKICDGRIDEISKERQRRKSKGGDR